MTRTPEPGRINIRSRIAIAVVLLVGCALSLVGVTLSTVERAATENEVAARLARAANEFRTLAAEGVDPTTGRPFDNPTRLLEVALQRTVLSSTEGEMALVNGHLRFTGPEQLEFQPQRDADLLAHVTKLADLHDISHGTLKTSVTTYRYVVVPVFFEATGERGGLVRVADLNAELDVVDRLMRIYALVAVGSILLVASFTWVIAGRLLRPIEWLREVAESISEDDLTTRVPVTGSDDLTRLTVTMNGMLDRVAESVEAQRRLMDDVGHELRTPVTVVRGHLELMDANDPTDVRATQSLAMDELDRMGGLVTDLLTLAKSDRPDFIVPTWTNVAMLNDSTLEKARALSQHRWLLGPMADLDAWLDPNRITQAWLQLAHNASKYSEVGSKIELGSAVDGDHVRLWVRDEGIGIPPEEMKTIRERFGRSKAGRIHADGVGLGLAIVGSITQGHGGRLDIVSTQGVGSVFTMVLPITPQPQE